MPVEDREASTVSMLLVASLPYLEVGSATRGFARCILGGLSSWGQRDGSGSAPPRLVGCRTARRYNQKKLITRRGHHPKRVCLRVAPPLGCGQPSKVEVNRSGSQPLGG